jgi:CspA family cold shock protein
MAHAASLVARIVVACGLALASLAFAQQGADAQLGADAEGSTRDPLCMGDPCADVKWESQGGCVALLNSTSKIMSVDAAFLGGGGHKFTILPGEIRRLEFLMGCVTSVDDLKSVDIACITETDLTKSPQLPPPSSSDAPLSAKTDVESESEEVARQTGTVMFYNHQKGYGFIKPDDGGNDIFVHHTAVELSGIGELVEGMRITFATEPGSNGLRAVNLQQIPN